MSTGRSALEAWEKTTEKEFHANRRVLGFDEYLSVLGESPERQLRGTAAYGADMMDHFGKKPLAGDAAHPMYPRGSNGSAQSLIDARTLAERLASNSDPLRALDEYEDSHQVWDVYCDECDWDAGSFSDEGDALVAQREHNAEKHK